MILWIGHHDLIVDLWPNKDSHVKETCWLGIVEISKYAACKNNGKKQKDPLNFVAIFVFCFQKLILIKKKKIYCVVKIKNTLN